MAPDERAPAGAPELWAGVECTVNRVGERFFDQLERGGHARRPADLDLLAALGVRAVRYPVLWERTAPDGLGAADWSWADRRLARLRELSLRPVVGLVHHGSGPRGTCLTDDEFPQKLAAYARAVAARYPHVEDYTPVNEPLTTARFSCLYGHWYPHARGDREFVRALITQARAVVLSMRAVREVNPRARLVQTEDLGKTHSTPRLGYQAEFENERRWLTFDLLAGRVVPGHAMWDYLRRAGTPERELWWLAENRCPPDIVGVNHYVTSERFLDERLARYPPHTHGGNGRDAYADVEAVRVRAEGPDGPRVLLREAWERFGLPLAVTEAHLGCTREEQLRWLGEVWAAASSLRARGADVRAVTAWSAFGAIDWHALLTRDEGRYEPGVFDARSDPPRPTALASMLRSLAARGAYDHPALDTPGWWRRMDRFCYPPVPRTSRAPAAQAQRIDAEGRRPRPLLIAGAGGTLGRAFARACQRRGLSFEALTRRELDIADADSVAAAFALHGPWAVVNAAGCARVDDAERDPTRAARENTEGPARLAEACAARGVALVTFSSAHVFDGAKRGPYVEADEPSPASVYGRAQLEAERLVGAAHPRALVVRAGDLFGPWDESNFVTAALAALAAGRRFAAAADLVVSPTYVPDLAGACLDLLIDGESGLWHLANEGAVTWAGLAREVARRAGLDPSLVDARPHAALGLRAPRPARAALASRRAPRLLPPLEDALGRYLAECERLPKAGRASAGGRRL